jgi:hypothetical protein
MIFHFIFLRVACYNQRVAWIGGINTSRYDVTSVYFRLRCDVSFHSHTPRIKSKPKTLSRQKRSSVPLHTLKTCRGSRGMTALIHNFGTRLKWAVNIMPRSLYPPCKESQCKFNRVGHRADWRTECTSSRTAKSILAGKSFGRRPSGRREVDGRLA